MTETTFFFLPDESYFPYPIHRRQHPFRRPPTPSLSATCKIVKNGLGGGFAKRYPGIRHKAVTVSVLHSNRPYRVRPTGRRVRATLASGKSLLSFPNRPVILSLISQAVPDFGPRFPHRLVAQRNTITAGI